MIWSKRFLADAAERALKAAAGVLLVAVQAAAGGPDILHSDWKRALIEAASVAVASVLMSVASAKSPGISPASLVPPGV